MKIYHTPELCAIRNFRALLLIDTNYGIIVVITSLHDLLLYTKILVYIFDNILCVL